MKKSKLLPFFYAGVLAFTAAGVAVTIGPNLPKVVTVARAADTQFDLSDRAAGKWELILYGSDLAYQNTDYSFYNKTNTLTQPTLIPTNSVSNYSDTNKKTFVVNSIQLFPENQSIYYQEQWYSDAYQTEVIEYNPDGKVVPNSSLKVVTDPNNSANNNGEIVGISTMQPGDVAIVKVTPVKASLKGKAYFFFNGTGKYTPNISYAYAFDGAATPTKIADITGPSPIDVPAGAKTLQIEQTGYIDPQWTGGDANVKIDPNTGKITGLDNPAEAGKTLTFTVTHGIDSTITHTFNVKIPAKTTPVNPVNPVTPSNGGGSSSNNNGGNSGNNAWNPSNPNTPNGTGLPNYAAVKGAAVYATKGIYMYSDANFKKSERIATYPKAKRVNRPMFVVVGYENANNGALRYKVRDVNHGKKTAGKVGYITANRKYVVNVYYQTLPSNKRITVIGKKGVHAYKNASLTGRAKSYKIGTRLTVKKLVKHNLTTRYQLSNGYYVTANKKLVIQGNY